MDERKVIDIGEEPRPGIDDGRNAYGKPDMSDFARRLVQPLSQHGWPKWLVYAASLVGFVYLLNPTAGFLEFIPDNIPLIGNLDEGVAFMLILSGLIEFFDGRKKP